MKRLLLVIALSATMLAAKQREWRAGKLISFTDVESSRPVEVVEGGAIISAHRITYHAEVQDGKTSYFGEATLHRHARIPRLTENAPVRYTLENDSLYLMGDDGREMKMHLIKQRAN